MRDRWLMLGRCLGAVCLAGVSLLSGCYSGSAEGHRIARYRPDVNDRASVMFRPAPVVSPVPVPVAVPVPVITQPAGPVGLPSPDPVVKPAPAANSAKILKRGDGISVELRGIPQPESIKGEIDDLGLNLPLIGRIKIDGKTTFEAEQLIERAYIDGGFYNKINVIVTSQNDEYFVTGEVKLPGRFLMNGDRTLLQAITSAGGYTDFAKKTRVKVMRGQGRDKQILYFDCDDIEQGREKDPLVKPGDVIDVPRRLFL